MKPELKTNRPALLIYSALLIISYLSSAYLGGLFRFIFIFLIFLLFFSPLHLLIALKTLTFNQEFSTYYPVKGEEILFRFKIKNNAFLPTPLLMTRFRFEHLTVNREEQTKKFSLLPGRTSREERTVVCRYRGNYAIGMPLFRMNDTLGFFTMEMNPGNKVFTVPPRIISLKSPPFFLAEGASSFHGEGVGARSDVTLFAGYKSYRPGESVEKIAWKKYAATGVPVLKDSEGSSRNGITIYFDQQQSAREKTERLTEEDCAVELLLACVKYLLDQKIPLEIFLDSESFFKGFLPVDFDRFYRKTMELQFAGKADPAAICLKRVKTCQSPGPSLIITHRTAPETMDRIDQARKRGIHISAVSCTTGFSLEERDVWQAYISGLNQRGNRIRIVDSIEDMDTRLATP
ncbi:MAG: DUF58 domain-containing protein [Spirochaetales bacterium]|nr:DUF58 domain-containing protein [Spirochaetales bacterium]